ncbi:Hermansky-Pudlak syndrome 5 protein isoform X2 [Gadus macrocephalus]|uniref:Hermansky-Pudlak syndrome 5 protein isoform X2 n=1 Tax=Gadus macrocephalus TaxID=80720 RepID=UPI0028CB2BCE|nr:Hermansky-Pudlak syndrome 5 protein isoform X2 [Gadus macrocephalus]
MSRGLPFTMPPVPVVPEGQSHVLAEFDCLDPLLSALRLDSGRLKCTCLAVSKKWLGLGTSAGGLHLIQREGWKQRLILTHKEGSIIQVACCPSDEDFIAVATSQGLVAVWELQLERRGRPERVSVSWEHRGQQVTALCWDSGSPRVFAGDQGGKVSFLRAGSTKLSKAATFVVFPVQTVTTVDSRVVQLGHQEGRLLVSSLSRCYLCDTEREKFWRIGNKERDGEYGACFFPQSRGLAGGPPPLLYCARPGSRIWESSFSGEVLSTHQFKQLLACPPLPLISYRSEPQYVPAQRSSQSIAFSKLLYLGDQHLLTWTDSAIYIFRPQSGQVLLWSEIKGVVDIAVHRSELFCLHGNGQMSHLSLVSAERCVERLLRRDAWVLAASVCCMFPHALVPSRTRKLVPIDRVEHLKTQLSPASHPELIRQLDEVISRLEPLDSASSSRRSSISSHESFNVLDCGIYRVISRRGSQSEEETGSFINQSASEEDRLKEFAFGPEEDQGEQEAQGPEAERPEAGLPFHLNLPFRPNRIALQAVKDSVSSFVKKTTEKINTLQMNTDLWQRSEAQLEVLVATSPSSEDMDHEVCTETENELQELRAATERATLQIQDPFVLMDPAALGAVLREWLQVLERVLGVEQPGSTSEDGPLKEVRTREERSKPQSLEQQQQQQGEPPLCSSSWEPIGPETGEQPPPPEEENQGRGLEPESGVDPESTEDEEEENAGERQERCQSSPVPAGGQTAGGETAGGQTAGGETAGGQTAGGQTAGGGPAGGQTAGGGPAGGGPAGGGPAGGGPAGGQTAGGQTAGGETAGGETAGGETAGGGEPVRPEPVRVQPPTPLPSDLLGDLTPLATLYLEMSCFRGQGEEPGVLSAAGFLRRYFFLLDAERVRRACLLCHAERPEMQSSFIEAVQELTRSSKVVEVIQKGDLLKSLRGLRELQPWSAPELLAHTHRLYERHGEAAVRSFSQFHPAVTPADVALMAQPPHFLAYLDNLVQSHAEEQRLSFLGSLLQSESLRQDWLELGLSHDAPQPSDTLTADGQPRWHSHFFSWGYGRLLSLLIQLPADLSSKETMAETCRCRGYWTGFLYLCCELQRRTEAFSTICRLDDMSLLEDPQVVPQTVQEWKVLIQLSQQCSTEPEPAPPTPNGTATLVNGSAEGRRRQVTPENLTLRLAQSVGPDRALEVLEGCGLPLALSPHSALVCELLRVAEKRQRATIQTMLERCDRFLWSQHA